MSAIGTTVTVTTSPTLVFQTVDNYAEQVSPPANVLKAGTPNQPCPVLIIMDPSATVYFGGIDVDSSGFAATAATLPSLAYNVVGNDSLYAVVASGTATLQLLANSQ